MTKKAMKSNIIFLVLFAFSAIAAADKQTNKQEVDLSKSTGVVSFLAVGRPSAIKIRGEGGHPTGLVTIDNHKLSGKLNFDLNSLKTGIDTRDHHMKEKYLDTSKYPEAELTILNTSLPDNFSKDAKLKNIPFKGRLKLKDKEKDINGHFDLDRDNQNISLRAEFSLNLGSYGIDIPKYMGITVAEDVTVTTDLKAELTDK